jgi:hypothetical protein
MRLEMLNFKSEETVRSFIACKPILNKNDRDTDFKIISNMAATLTAILKVKMASKKFETQKFVFSIPKNPLGTILNRF